MASPEIKLPREASQHSSQNDEIPASEKNESCSIGPDNKTEHDPVARPPTLLDDVPTICHYLTFETELPLPTSLGPTHDGSPAPEHPNLRDYVSPFTWSESRKSFITWLSCLITVVTAYTAGSYSPVSDQLSEYWGVSQTAILVGITTFTTGFATAPMFLAPFSEINGRRPVFIATGILFVICQLCCAVTRSYPGMLVARFFAGVGGSTFSTMVGGVVSDIYHSEGEYHTSL